jgi:hypothetical protein
MATDMKEKKQQPLAEVLAAAMKGLSNRQLSAFKRELERKLPEAIAQAAQAAQANSAPKGGGGDKT